MPRHASRCSRWLLCALLPGCIGVSQASAQLNGPERAAVECSVWLAILDIRAAGSEPLRLTIANQTLGSFPYSRGDFFAPAFEALDPEASMLADYRAQNATVSLLDRACFANLDYVTFTDGYGSEAWPVVHLAVSRVGFSLDMQSALVHTFFSCGPRCGSGAIRLLARQGAGWVEVDNRMTMQM